MASLETNRKQTGDYARAGVNRAAADRLVSKIALISKPTLNKKVVSSIGGYASLYALDRDRLIAASTDGVGTKLKLAFRLDRHETVGIDLVAMSVNDLLCVGAEPLFFLDYFATGKLRPKVAERVLAGIVDGCTQAGCALVGGETAELPDLYAEGEYDLAGFAVGSVATKDVLPRARGAKAIQPGDALIAIRSSGFHSNGFSLLRKLIPKGSRGDQLAADLLTPTRIYARAIVPLLRKGWIKGLAHITGSAFLNVPRMSEQVGYHLELPPASRLPTVFEWVREETTLSFTELAQTFNLGVGMVAVVAPQDAARVLKQLRQAGEIAWLVGETVRRPKGKSSFVTIRQGSEAAHLKY